MNIVTCTFCGSSVQDHHKRCPVCDRPLEGTPRVPVTGTTLGLFLAAAAFAVGIGLFRGGVIHLPDNLKNGTTINSGPKAALPRKTESPPPEKRKSEWDFWNSRNREEERVIALQKSAVAAMEEFYGSLTTANEADHIRRLFESAGGPPPGVGRDWNVCQLFIFSQDGVIRHSLNPGDVGKKASELHYDQYPNSPAQGAISGRNSQKEFCMVRPVSNGQGCHGCHPRKNRILGILDVCVAPVP